MDAVDFDGPEAFRTWPRSVDAERCATRFTPRKPGSNRSAAGKRLT